MASSSDVGAVLELPVVAAPPVEQTALACDGESGLPAPAVTTTEDSREPLLQERRDDETAPGADHHEAEAVAPAAEVSASEEPDEQQKPPVEKEEAEEPEESTRERLKRHRREMAGRVWVPELWGQEKLLKDWVDCAVFDRPMVPAGLLTARRALIAECCPARRRPDHRTSPTSSAGSSPLQVQNGCS